MMKEKAREREGRDGEITWAKMGIEGRKRKSTRGEVMEHGER